MLTEKTGERITAPPLFVQTGESFERASDALVMDCAREALTKRFRPGALLLNSSHLVRDFLSLQIGTRHHEVFAVILLDPCCRLINSVELSHGTVDACPIYTRPMVQCVVMHAATQVVLVHNYPSGESEPSRADLGVTARVSSRSSTGDSRSRWQY